MSQGSATNPTRLRAQLAQQAPPEAARGLFPGSGWVYIPPQSPPEVLLHDAAAMQLEEEKGASNLTVVVALLVVLVAIAVAVYWIRPPAESMATTVLPINTFTTNAYNPKQVIATELNMRERPSMRAPVQFILPLGTRVELLNEAQQEIDGGLWVKIRVQTAEGPQVGWVDAQYIR